MYTGVKSPTPEGPLSPNNVLFTDNNNGEEGSAAPGNTFSDEQLHHYMRNVRDKANITRGTYSASLRKLCVKIYDENTPISSMPAETQAIIDLDAKYVRECKDLQSQFKTLPKDVQAKYPLTEAQKFKVTRIGLPATRIIKGILEAEKDLADTGNYVERTYGQKDRKLLQELMKNKQLPEKDYKLLDR